jgi:hypothetical protein
MYKVNSEFLWSHGVDKVRSRRTRRKQPLLGATLFLRRHMSITKDQCGLVARTSHIRALLQSCLTALQQVQKQSHNRPATLANRPHQNHLSSSALSLRTIMKMSRAHANTDYGAPTARANKFHLHMIIANHTLHLISSLIVMSIAAYFIANFNHNTHIVYWVSIVCHDPNSIASLVSIYDADFIPTGRRRFLHIPTRRRTSIFEVIQRLPCPNRVYLLLPVAHCLHLRSAGLRVR